MVLLSSITDVLELLPDNLLGVMTAEAVTRVLSGLARFNELGQ